MLVKKVYNLAIWMGKEKLEENLWANFDINIITEVWLSFYPFFARLTIMVKEEV